MQITDECISCSACLDECTTEALRDAGADYTVNGQVLPALNSEHPYIVAELCDDCGTCVQVCPMDCIVKTN